jgi:hypothetical protein
MRLTWHRHLLGPFGIGGTIWQSRRRRPRREVYHGTLPGGWTCPHNHSREDTAIACAQREERRRACAGR